MGMLSLIALIVRGISGLYPNVRLSRRIGTVRGH